MLNSHVLPVSSAYYSKWSSCWPFTAPVCWSDGMSNLCSESHLTHECGPPHASVPSVLCYFYNFSISFFATLFFQTVFKHTMPMVAAAYTHCLVVISQPHSRDVCRQWCSEWAVAFHVQQTANCEFSEATTQCWLNDITENLWAGLYDSDSSTEPELLCGCCTAAAAAAAYFCSLFAHSVKSNLLMNNQSPHLWNDGHTPVSIHSTV